MFTEIVIIICRLLCVDTRIAVQLIRNKWQRTKRILCVLNWRRISIVFLLSVEYPTGGGGGRGGGGGGGGGGGWGGG